MFSQIATIFSPACGGVGQRVKMDHAQFRGPYAGVRTHNATSDELILIGVDLE